MLKIRRTKQRNKKITAAAAKLQKKQGKAKAAAKQKAAA